MYIVPSIVVVLMCLNLRNTEFSKYTKTHTYQCRVIGGEKTSGGYKRSAHMYLILQEVNTGKIFSIDAPPEDYHIYHNKPGTILTYTFKECFILPNKTYDKYRSIFILCLCSLFSFLFCTPIYIGLEEPKGLILEWVNTLWISSAILFVTTFISYNFII